jgi:putative transposase
MSDYKVALLPETYYHVFSRAVGNEKLFVKEENYSFFLKKFNLHVSPIANTYAWCLLPNHFHFLIRIKSPDAIEAVFKKIKTDRKYNPEITPDFLMEQFSNFLNSYSKAFNKTYDRKGALFMDYMRRVEVKEDEQFGATIFYIHKNPVHHGLCNKMEEWNWSSYNTFFSDAPTNIKRKEVLRWFQGMDAFRNYHQQTIYLKHAVIIE